jgi:hypothetical protein
VHVARAALRADYLNAPTPPFIRNFQSRIQSDKERIMRCTFVSITFGFITLFTCVAVAQEHHYHGDAGTTEESPAQPVLESHAMSHASGMPGLIWPAMSQESSGTAWQPRSTPMPSPMIHIMSDDWMWMAHGWAYLVYDHAGGDRGGDKTFSSNMAMIMGRRHLGPGVLGVRGMFSLEPATIGKSGYPLLLQTGETANGRTHLIDRQHPHDLFMELAVSYALPVNETDRAYIYLGLPGEPALGPPTFMHRFSGMDNPEAPISHHWLDSTHITFGVATVGYTFNNLLNVEGSIFTGREPDQSRWDIETPKMDSQSVRITYNPTDDWSFQVSYGRINSPEQLEPQVDQQRITASATYNVPFGMNHENNWQTTFAWGRNINDPGNTLDAFLIESAVNLNHTHTFFGRFENVQKDELFDELDALGGEIFRVNKLSIGYIYDFPESHGLQFGIGALGSIHFLPDDLEDVYGHNPTSYMLFGRVRW